MRTIFAKEWCKLYKAREAIDANRNLSIKNNPTETRLFREQEGQESEERSYRRGTVLVMGKIVDLPPQNRL